MTYGKATCAWCEGRGGTRGSRWPHRRRECVRCSGTGVEPGHWNELRGLVRGGADVDAIAEEYGITVDQLRAAVASS